MPYKTIKEVIDITGTTESALRYYAERNLLKPTIKKQTGRKEWLYDEEAIYKLRLILLFKKIGLTTEEIEKMFKVKTGINKDVLKKKKESLIENRNKLDNQISMVELLVLMEGLDDGMKEKLLEKVL